MTVVFHCNTEGCGNKVGELIAMGFTDYIQWTCGVCHKRYVIEIYVTKEGEDNGKKEKNYPDYS